MSLMPLLDVSADFSIVEKSKPTEQSQQDALMRIIEAIHHIENDTETSKLFLFANE